jgi:hypothetical protein
MPRALSRWAREQAGLLGAIEKADTLLLISFTPCLEGPISDFWPLVLAFQMFVSISPSRNWTKIYEWPRIPTGWQRGLCLAA